MHRTSARQLGGHRVDTRPSVAVKGRVEVRRIEFHGWLVIALYVPLVAFNVWVALCEPVAQTVLQWLCRYTMRCQQ